MLAQASQRLAQASQRLAQASLRLAQASLRLVQGGDGHTYGRTDVRTDVQIPPVFYKTSSPFGAEAQKGPLITIQAIHPYL